MADSDDTNKPKKPPKVVKFFPKGSKPGPPKVEATPQSTFETAADEWVQTEIGMSDLAKKWKVSRATVYRWRKEQNWDERKEHFNRLVEEKKAQLAKTPPPRNDETREEQTAEARRQARVDESAADKKAQAEVVLHEIAYALTGHLAGVASRDAVAQMQKPRSYEELARVSKNIAEFWERVVGQPEPPPKPKEDFVVRIQERGGAISTIERSEGESLEEVMARIDREAEEAKERALASVMEPASG